MKANYPLRIDETNGIVYAWFIRMEYRGGAAAGIFIDDFGSLRRPSTH